MSSWHDWWLSHSHFSFHSSGNTKVHFSLELLRFKHVLSILEHSINQSKVRICQKWLNQTHATVFDRWIVGQFSCLNGVRKRVKKVKLHKQMFLTAKLMSMDIAEWDAKNMSRPPQIWENKSIMRCIYLVTQWQLWIFVVCVEVQ